MVEVSVGNSLTFTEISFITFVNGDSLRNTGAKMTEYRPGKLKIPYAILLCKRDFVLVLPEGLEPSAH